MPLPADASANAALDALRAALPDLLPVPADGGAEVEVSRATLQPAAEILARHDYVLAGIVAEWTGSGWSLRYPFHDAVRPGFLHLLLHGDGDEPVPSISQAVFSADWHEREVEDLFEIRFTDHPLLGDFVLHNEDWPEGVAPMRPDFRATQPKPPSAGRVWRPQRFLDAEGAFSMTVGPVFSGVSESAQFRLESEGEQVVLAVPRLFYKYRGLEKIAQGQRATDALILAERLNATAAFSHGLAFVQALEAIAGTAVPPRAEALRVAFAELERLRSHAGTIEDLIESTGLTVPTALASAVVEDLLRLSGAAAGHRYLAGLVWPGGMTVDLAQADTKTIVAGVQHATHDLLDIVRRLEFDNGFLDRVEQVGTLLPEEALRYGVVGPIARASGLRRDLRVSQPYASYGRQPVQIACAEEGDAFARLRVLAQEAAESARLIDAVLRDLPRGPVKVPWEARGGSALGWSEAPIGAAFHWLRLASDATVVRWRVMPPSFTNWHALAPTVEGFAFQDFPIILASLGLSVAESDR